MTSPVSILSGDDVGTARIRSLAILTAARGLIGSPDKWTQGAFARNKSGERQHYIYEDGVCFCSLGALRRVARLGAYANHEESFAEYELRKAVSRDIAEFNDHPETTHAHVLAAFERAIAAISQESAERERSSSQSTDGESK